MEETEDTKKLFQNLLTFSLGSLFAEPTEPLLATTVSGSGVPSKCHLLHKPILVLIFDRF